jgi:MFS family permease
VARRGHCRSILAQSGFRRLYRLRLTGQFGDGVFQASLAGAVLFSPEHQANAADIAAGFAVLLVPYSLVGPFAGVLLDRWWRQRVLVVSSVLRACGVLVLALEIAAGLSGVAFYASALVVMSISRFFNAALSASLPHVVSVAQLVTANALSTTSGTIATAAGGGAAIGVRLITGGSNTAYALIAVAAAAPYLASAWAGRGFRRPSLGPDDAERAHRESVRDVALGLVAGARHLRTARAAFNAIAMVGVHRLCYGLWIVCAVLLYRNYFHAEGVFRAGLAGVGQLVAGIAAGGGLAALVTPYATRRIGYAWWPALLLALCGIVQTACGLPYRIGLVPAAALAFGFASRGISICVDTLVQQHVEDEYRGRVFALYDTVFNLALVAAALLTALALPQNGRAPVVVVVVGVLYVVTALGYLRLATRRTTGSAPPPPDRGRGDRVPSVAPTGAGMRARPADPVAGRGGA